MKTAGCFLALLVFVHALPVVAAAGDITLFGGFQNPGKLTLTEAGSSIASLTRPASFGVFGVRYSNNRSFAQEQTVAFAPNFIDSQSRAFILNSNILLQAPAPAIKPYATVGLGTIIVTGSGVSDIGTKFALNYGLGAKFMARGPVGARIDIRGYAIPSVQSQTLKVTEVTFGFVFSNSK